MLQIVRKFLIILLAMLQLLAPLVHAHTGNHGFSLGLHIPGLEPFITPQHATTQQEVKNDDSRLDTEGLIVVIDIGIKNPQDVITQAEYNDFAILSAYYFPSLSLSTSDYNFLEYIQSVEFRKQFSPLSPRAPPSY